MPIYEYGCEACEHQFERLQSISAPAPDSCPACGEPHVRKLVSATSFVLKGGGWYKDGYGLGSKKSGSGSIKPTAKEESTAKAAAK